MKKMIIMVLLVMTFCCTAFCDPSDDYNSGECIISSITLNE